MSLRYYYYISKGKIAMLKGQLQNRSHLSTINPKVEGFGISLELGFKSGEDESEETSLVYNTNKLIDILLEEKVVNSLKETTQFDSSNFYHDADNWIHGLYSIRDVSTGNYTVTYMVWKASGNRIFLLFGSPINVLGTKEVNAGGEHEASSSAIINNVIESSLTNELIRAIYDCSKADSSEKPSVTIPANHDSKFKINVVSWAPIARVRAEQNVLRGSALALLCQETQTHLASAKIEAVFKIYHDFPISRSIAPFDRLYLGSPIYTALT